MKKRINTICVIILLLVACNVFSAFYRIGYSFGRGFSTGLTVENAEGSPLGDTNIALPVIVLPNVGIDEEMVSEVPAADGSQVPVIWHSGIFFLKTSGNWPLAIALTTALCYMAIIVFAIRMLVLFIKFIVNINRGAIYDRKNVSRLDRIGIDLLIIALLAILTGLMQEIEIAYIAPMLKDYVIKSEWSMPWLTLTLAFVSRLVSQIMKKAIILHEEQSLTI